MLNNALLICPSDRTQVGRLADLQPLCAVPMGGRSLIEYWLATLALEKVERVLIIADDRTEAIEHIVQDGTPWGVKAEVRRQRKELTPAQALLEYQQELGQGIPNKNVAVLDHFPGLAQFPLFISYSAWFAGLMAWLPRARTPDRVGIRELSPGIWVGHNSRISPTAELRGPCWIGENVVISDRCVIGPETVIENECMIDSDSRVVASYVGPSTYVGRFSEVAQSIARGSLLTNWQSACTIQVPDRFVLSSLGRPDPPKKTLSRGERLTSLWRALVGHHGT